MNPAPVEAPLPADSAALPWPGPGALLAERTPYRGWTGYTLANEFVRLVAVPAIGGRIMALDLRGDGAQTDHSFLWTDPALEGKLFSPEENQGDGTLGAWKNYGGDKTWPAPQGWERDDQWHGPPDPVLDTGRYRVEEFGPRPQNDDTTGAVQLRMISPPEARTGLQIRRSFRLVPGSSRIELLLGFRNASSRPVRWSIWDIVQFDASRPVAPAAAFGSASAVGGMDFDPSCAITAPVPAPARAQTPGAPPPFHILFGSPDNPQWSVEAGLFHARYQWQIGKVGIRSPGGWVAFSQASCAAAFVARFAVDPTGHYPDDGSTVECWTVGAGQVGNLDYEGTGIYLMEAEVLSPLHTIEPGREAHFAITWGLCRCAGPVLHSEEGGCSVERLSAAPGEGGLRLRGRFGVFDEGTLECVWLDAHGQRLGSQALAQMAAPTRELLLDAGVMPPQQAAAVELWLRSIAAPRRIDSCALGGDERT